MLGQIFEFLFHVRKKNVFWCEIFKKSPKNFNGNSHSKLPAPPGVRQSILAILHDFAWIFARKNVFSNSPDLYRCEISLGIHFWWFQTDTGSQSWSKVEKPNKKNRQTRKSGQPSLSIIPGCHCSYCAKRFFHPVVKKN